MTGFYLSPRWSQEITDCSMPMTFDTYSKCAYGCHYCFSIYQRDIGPSSKNFRSNDIRSVDPRAVKRIFTHPESSQFGEYVKHRLAMQWGGLSDQFDEYERKYGITLELLRFFREIEYPICFSTKSNWWAFDDRYRECFKDAKHFNTKFSIITLDADAARKVEAGCPSPQDRLKAMAAVAKLNAGGVTLRLRPYIIGLSDKTVVELIKQCADAGATALSTEFFCLELRCPSGKDYHFPKISEVVGFDIIEYYRKRSSGTGYLRLTRDIKRRYVDQMEELCDKYKMRFYVSDAHFKERCHNGSCCGLGPDWNYSKGTFCEALQIAKRTGTVRWSDIECNMTHLTNVPWDRATAYNVGSSEKRASMHGFSMVDYLRYCWNHPSKGQGPYRMFEGVIKPTSADKEGNLVYVLDKARL